MVMSMEDKVAAEDEQRRKSSFSEMLLRHLVTGKCLRALDAPFILLVFLSRCARSCGGMFLLWSFAPRSVDRQKLSCLRLPLSMESVFCRLGLIKP